MWSGSGLAEELASGVRAGRAGDRVVPLLPSRALGAGCSPGVGLEVGEDGVADAPFEGAECFFAGLSLGEFLVEVGAACAVTLADLGDCGHMDGMVETSVPAPRQPVDRAVA